MTCNRPTRRALGFLGLRAAAWLAAAGVPTGLGERPAGAQAVEGANVRVMRATPQGGQAAGLGYDGLAPGPTLRLRRGEELRLRLVNGLAEPTSVLWHGLRRANGLTSPPRRPSLAAGESVDIRFACPDAGTFWYHAVDERQRRRGLFGLVVVEEAAPVAVERELALLIAEPWTPAGAAPAESVPVLVANGAPAAVTSVRPNERLRLRLVNAGTKVAQVRLDRLRPVVMALDGHPCEPFAARDGRIFLGPGNRADLFVDVTLASGAAQAVIGETESGTATLGTLACAGAPVRPAPLAEPTPLPDNPLPARMDFSGALKLDLDLAATSPGLPPRPALTVRRGRTVMLGLVNRSSDLATVRIDGHSFRLLDRLDDGWKPFWLDTIVVPPGRPHRIAFVAEEAGAWMIESAGPAGQPGFATWFQVS